MTAMYEIALRRKQIPTPTVEMRIPAAAGPALLFENPRGSKIPVLINAFASMSKMKLALQVDDIDEVAGRIAGGAWACPGERIRIRVVRADRSVHEFEAVLEERPAPPC